MLPVHPELLKSEVEYRISAYRAEAKRQQRVWLNRQTRPRPAALRQRIGWTLIRWGTNLAQSKA